VRSRVDLKLLLAVAALAVAVASRAGPGPVEVPLWVETTPATRPPRTSTTADVAYDSVAQRVVFPENGDLWSFDGAAWTLVPANGPAPPRVTANVLAFDRARGVLVGYGSGSVGEVWEWSQGTWTQGPTSPTNLAHLVFDDRLGKIVGIGTPPDGGPVALFAYDGVTWTPLAGANPPIGLNNYGVTYDRARDRIVVFGGGFYVAAVGPDGNPSDETWEWNGAAWDHPQPLIRPTARSARLAYDEARGRTVLFGGTGYAPPQQPLGDTWEWDGTAWEPRFPSSAPEPRLAAPMAYDAHRRRVVLVGHGESLGTANDTWEYSTYAGSCATAADCDTAICDHGLCCHDACGTCQHCDPSGVGCLAVQGADDPDTCTGALTCDAAGRCKQKGGQACQHASDCASGECAAGTCCSAHCAPYACDGAGACKTRCQADTDCAGTALCKAGACVAPPSTCAGPAKARSSLGTEQDCTPFACDPGGGGCRTACTTSDDCADGFLCSSGRICRSAPPSTAAGCAVAQPGRGAGTPACSVAMLAAFFALGGRRRRRERERGDDATP
jgi:hypothetical protein